MLLTVSLSGWHKDGARSILMPTPGDPKGPRSFQLRGPFALPGYVTCLRSLRRRCLEGMGDGRLAETDTHHSRRLHQVQRRLVPESHRFICRSTTLLTRLPESLNPLAPCVIRHEHTHDSRNGLQRCPILSGVWSHVASRNTESSKKALENFKQFRCSGKWLRSKARRLDATLRAIISSTGYAEPKYSPIRLLHRGAGPGR